MKNRETKKKIHYASTVIDKKKRVLNVVKNTKDGSWTVFYSINKKRKQMKFATKELAQEWVDDFECYIKGKRKTIVGSGDRKVTEIELAACLKEAIDHQLELGRIGESSHYYYWKHLKTCFPEEVKTMILSKVDDEAIKKIRRHCQYTARGERSNGNKFLTAIKVLKKVNAHAKEKGYAISLVDIDGISTPVKRKDNRKTYDIEDYKKTLAFVRDTDHAMKDRVNAALLAINMQLGLRVGELVAIKLEDIDFKSREVYVERTQTRGKGGLYVVGETTKSKKSRAVSMSSTTMTLMKFVIDAMAKPRYVSHPKQLPHGSWQVVFSRTKGRQKMRTFDTFEEAQAFRMSILECRSDFEDWFSREDHKYLIPSPSRKGRPIATVSLQSRWSGALIRGKRSDGTCSKIGIPYINTHNGGRKTMATITSYGLHKQGASLFDIARTIQEILGHSDMATTIKHYILPLGLDSERATSVFEVEEEQASGPKDMNLPELIKSMTDRQKKELSELVKSFEKDPA